MMSGVGDMGKKGVAGVTGAVGGVTGAVGGFFGGNKSKNKELPEHHTTEEKQQQQQTQTHEDPHSLEKHATKHETNEGESEHHGLMGSVTGLLGHRSKRRSTAIKEEDKKKITGESSPTIEITEDGNPTGDESKKSPKRKKLKKKKKDADGQTNDEDISEYSETSEISDEKSETSKKSNFFTVTSQKMKRSLSPRKIATSNDAGSSSLSESAELSTSIVPSSPIHKEGSLEKTSGNLLKVSIGSKKKYCVLEDNCFLVFKSKKDFDKEATPSENFPLGEISVAASKHSHSFEIHHAKTGHTHTFKCATEDLSSWLSALNNNMLYLKNAK